MKRRIFLDGIVKLGAAVGLGASVKAAPVAPPPVAAPPVKLPGWDDTFYRTCSITYVAPDPAMLARANPTAKAFDRAYLEYANLMDDRPNRRLK